MTDEDAPEPTSCQRQLQLALEVARRRSREAEFATDATAAESTPVVHRHAATLHREATDWNQRAERFERAAAHVESAKVHDQIAERIEVDHGPQ